MGKPFFITTAIDYTNGAPHIGHAYEKVLADVLARYHRLKDGDDGKPQEVFFLTGVDQHGQKVQQSADKAGVAPQEFVDGITKKFTALWEKLDVKYDAWAATTDPLHKECVRANLQKLWDDKDPATGGSRWIYKKTQRGFYSVRQEQFLTDKERGPDGQFGPEWGLVEERDEENFYFRLTQDPATGLPGCDPKQWLLDLINKRSADAAQGKGKQLVVPENRLSALREAASNIDGDLCISRPASRLKWGIPFPESFGAGFVTYVWFDALVNYISYAPGHDPDYDERKNPWKAAARGANVFADWWPPLHVIGKDILIPAHGVYWPIMLKALGFTDEEMPTFLVHGWWNIRGKGGESEKMSKSLGNVVDPDALADKYGVEALRYYLVRDIGTGRDADFSEERLAICYNTDLANSIGNLLNRTLNMAAKYRNAVLRKADVLSFDPEKTAEDYRKFVIGNYTIAFEGYYEEKSGTKENPHELWDAYQINIAIAMILNIASGANQLIEIRKPWVLAKDPAKSSDLDAVLYTLAESLRIIAILIWPVLPDAAHGIFDQLAWKLDEAGEAPNSELGILNSECSEREHARNSESKIQNSKLSRRDSRFRLADAVWGGLPDGHVLGKPVPLFPRIEIPPATTEK